MPLPDVDPRTLLRAAFPQPEALGRELLDLLAHEVGAARMERARKDVEALALIVESEPAHVVDEFCRCFCDLIPLIDRALLERVVGRFLGVARISAERVSDLVLVLGGVMVRQDTRKKKDEPGFGRAYTFFRQAISMYPHAVRVACERRRVIEGELERHLIAINDLQLVPQFLRVIDDEPTTDLSQRLADIWFRAYEAPIQRVCLLIWLIGEEIEEPGNIKEPPMGHAGTLFEQAAKAAAEHGLAFPFRQDLNKLRNAIHKRQTKVALDGTIEFRGADGVRLASLSFEELCDAVSEDLAFCTAADHALERAFMAEWAQQGVLDAEYDAAWQRLAVELETSGVKIHGILRPRSRTPHGRR